ncbi:GNAT family N-acetyltransferase [Terasakiella sp. SH-1]|uniref:GNAT family N-acetyltransferase n=1 Tax=Terasakiella sp. SH-1 TaxID=2560057 RepID=UPI0010748547|nr:GNAT family N-acetyltransferase [Terasakiella sp. SH-1]
MSPLIQQIEAQDTYLMRHKVLWPDLPLEECMLKGDDVALHFGAFVEDHLIGVLSLFPDNDQSIRLRKFAISPRFQGQGIGLLMLKTVLEELGISGNKSVWCDARANAVDFYRKAGFEIEGNEFLKRNIPYYKMSCHFR